MKSQEYLQRLHQNQVDQFNLKKETKIANLEKSIQDTQEKLDSLSNHLTRLQTDLRKVKAEQPLSFEEFFRKIQSQSEKNKSESKTKISS